MSLDLPEFYQAVFWERGADGILRPRGCYGELIPAFKRGDLKVHENDVYVVAYPKSGTHWVRNIVAEIISEGDTSKAEQLKKAMPLEVLHGVHTPQERINSINQSKPPILRGSHLRYENLPKGAQDGECRVICVLRNPKDVATSFYHFHRANKVLGNFKGSWSDWLPYYLSGNVIFGDWFDHTLDWWSHRNKEHVLIVKFEDLKINTPDEIKRIAKHIGYDLKDDELKRVLERTSFERSKAEYKINALADKFVDKSISDFYRKGTFGDWKNCWTVAQTEMFNPVYEERMRDSGLTFIFE